MPRRKKAADQIVEMAVFSVIGKSARCRLLRDGRLVNLQAQGADVPATRIDATVETRPLGSEARVLGDPGAPIANGPNEIIARGPRTAYEMEMVTPGYDFQDPDRDPIWHDRGPSRIR